MLDFFINIYKKYGYLFQGKLFYAIILFYKQIRVDKSAKTTSFWIFKNWSRIKVYGGNKAEAISKLLSAVELDAEESNNLFYSIDIFKTCKLYGRVLGNCTVNYQKVIDGGIKGLFVEGNDKYALNNNKVVNAIIDYINRIQTFVNNSNIDNKDEISRSLRRMIDKEADSMFDVLQRILIINQIQWQTGHILVGIGRLDYLLDRFETDEATANVLLEEFFTLLHKYYAYKSNALMGDTGQIIVLGGSNKAGEAFYNMYTEIILNLCKKKRTTEPKIIYRICKKTDEKIWDKLIDGIGSNGMEMLLSSDDAIIPALVDFGYEEDDAYNYITSACWEPIAGLSFEQNNILSINFLEPIKTIVNGKSANYESFDEILQRYRVELDKYIDKIFLYLNRLKWDEDILYSMFEDSAREKHLYVGAGGEKYNNYGLLAVGLSNAINSLVNIKKLVFEDNFISLNEWNRILCSNYRGHEDFANELKNNTDSFGTDDSSIVELTNDILRFTKVKLGQFQGNKGQRIKLGLSSPHYIMNSKRFPASYDGRKKGEPFGIHISADGKSYTELFNFAAEIDYEDGCFNGNVVDFLVQPDLIKSKSIMFKQLVKVAFDKGVYQMQIHTIDYKTLIEAKYNPEKFPNLIVRVWGFNAYFNELPEEYKDYLIERAKRSELAVS